ncbi:MAG: helix-turn-helix domain-containing protein [Prevotella sp.]|nr:helix-turn-helix domain-containing protein [Prevotella sp.]MBO6144439.1 helix-turn-helix domain-containing protein [Prevotella sp.]
MKQKYLVIILFVLIVASGVTSLRSYRTTERQIERDMGQALSAALAQQQSDVITQDTIRTFNSNLQIAELRGKATIAVDTKGREFRAYARCSEATIFSLSDQRLTAVLWSMTLLWAAFCFYRRRHEMLQMAGMLQYGGLCFAEAEGTFYDAKGQRIKLTPMQQQLMEMFFRSEAHQLTKTEICDALWPKKPDASETLYTLIRRLKPIVEQHSDLKIEADRGKSYGLIIK